MSYDTDWSLIDFSEPKKTGGAKASPVSVPKGHCPKCGKHIGRGLHFHVKACSGDDDTRNA